MGVEVLHYLQSTVYRLKHTGVFSPKVLRQMVVKDTVVHPVLEF